MFHDSFNPVIGISITTMMLNTKEVGLAAVAMLEEKMLRPDVALPPQPVEETLFEGQTCGPPQ
jgi:DNA-binding LacI/PurR family transcriptional regulator